jgi:hypothetical protein
MLTASPRSGGVIVGHHWAEFVAERQWTKLALRMLKLSSKQHDLYTARFVYRAVIMILRVFENSVMQSILARVGDKSRNKSQGVRKLTGGLCT